jgi:Nucleotidyl transferase AbiEii toxin, Type IV TA system
VTGRPHHDRPPGDMRGMERWLTEWSKSERVSVGRLRRRVGIIAVAAMLQESTGLGHDQFVIKGGAAFEMRFGSRARSTADLDAVFRGNMDHAVAALTAATATGWSGFLGSVVDLGSFEVPGVRIAPRRATVKLTYLGKPFVSIPFEVAAPEGRSIDAVDLVPIAPLAEVGLAGPEAIACLSVAYQIAQKIHACSSPPGESRTNDRVRDLADLILLSELATVDLSATRTACMEIFALRNMQIWPPIVVVHGHWPKLWARIVDEDEFFVRELTDAAERVQSLIDQIEAARA